MRIRSSRGGTLNLSLRGDFLLWLARVGKGLNITNLNLTSLRRIFHEESDFKHVCDTGNVILVVPNMGMVDNSELKVVKDWLKLRAKLSVATLRRFPRG